MPHPAPAPSPSPRLPAPVQSGEAPRVPREQHHRLADSDLCVPLATHADDVVEAGGSEKTEAKPRAGGHEDEAAPVPEVEVEEEAGQPRENGQEESLAIAWAEPEDEPGPKVSSPFLM